MAIIVALQFNGTSPGLGFFDLWLWLVFAIIGLLFVILEFIIGIETSFDLAIFGSVFIFSGLATWPFHSWVLTVILTSILCIAYVAIGRRYVHGWAQVKKERTNIDAIIGKRGIVLHSITRNVDGLVKIRNEQWKARAEEDIEEGEEVVVTSVSGVTLTVDRIKGGV
jgi:membrane protein implicated in regulation of membrane protease activity